MLRNCAAILFVCFDMTACDALSLFSRPAALDYETPADREGRQSGLHLRIAHNSRSVGGVIMVKASKKS